jgi:hypothetical protein
VIPEVITYSLVGGSSGIIQLRIYRQDPSTGLSTYDISTNITYGCSGPAFTSALNNFNSFYGYQVSTVQNIYDVNNNTLNSLVGAARIDYVVSIYVLRPAAYSTENFILTKYGYTGNFVRANVQSHSPLMTGSFTLTIGKYLIDPYKNGTIPFNIPNSVLQTTIQAAPGFQNVQVDNLLPIDYGYSNKWIIRYMGYNGAVTPITVNGMGLTGPTPTVTASTRTAYSSAITFDPIDYRFLTTASSSPSVLVKVNGVPSVCVGNCAYTFVDYSEITALSYSGSTLTLGLSDVQSKGLTLSSVAVQVGASPCTSPTGTFSSFTCTLPTNSDSSPTLVAGSLTPLVTINSIGIAPLHTGVSPLPIPLLTNSLSLSTGGNNGGYVIGILGSGFPLFANQV